MLKNYFKIAIRNIFKRKVHSFVSIVGLAIGMAACITIFVFVRYEYSYDSFNKKADRIYRVNVEVNQNNKNTKFALTPAPLGPFLKDKFPQIENETRVFGLDWFTSISNPALKYKEKIFRANQFIFVDSTFFDVFPFKVIRGNPATALSSPFSLILTKSASQKFFGDENPIGKSIKYNNKFTFTVTGVVQDPPPNSTIRFDYLASLSSLPRVRGNLDLLKDNNFNYYTFILLNKQSNIENVEKRLPKVIAGFWGNELPKWLGSPKFYFEPLREQYWDSSLEFDIPVKGSRSSANAFAIIAVIILLIACANFINLSTARALNRAKEVGIRKVVGGNRMQIVRQFMMESWFISFIALLAAIALSEFFIPVLNKLLELNLKVDYFHNISILFIITGILIFAGLLSGLLPAFYLSSFRPASTLKGNIKAIRGKYFGRRFFILFQFSAVIALTFCVIVIAKQYDLMKFRNTGFDKENIIVLKYDQSANGSYIPFKQKLLKNSHILSVAATDNVPGNNFSKGPLFFKKEKSGEGSLMFSFVVVDPDFIKVLGIKLIAGRDFLWSEQKNYSLYILNETAIKKIGWTPEEAIGKPFGSSSGNLKGKVVGVISDFNFQSLRNKVEPLTLELGNDVSMLAVRISSKNTGATLAFINKTWKQMYPDIPIDYSFLNKSLDALYKSEEKLGILFTWFTLLSIVIACLGLYGLVLYTAERKTKEIGVRKVLGASVPGVTMLLIKEFAKWVLIANIIAWPIAYYFMHKWLQNFAYKINISWWLFILAGGIAFIIALLTVSFQAIKAATANPVKSLKYE